MDFISHYVAEAAGEKCRFTNEKIEFRENSVERKWTLPFNRHFIEKHLFVRCIYNSLEAIREWDAVEGGDCIKLWAWNFSISIFMAKKVGLVSNNNVYTNTSVYDFIIFFSIFLQKFHHFSYSKRIECWRNFATHLKHTRIPWSAIEWARIVVVSIFYSTSDHSFEHDSHFLCLSRNIFNLVTLVTIVRQHRFPHVHHRTRFKNELIFWLSNAASEQQKGGIVAVWI